MKRNSIRIFSLLLAVLLVFSLYTPTTTVEAAGNQPYSYSTTSNSGTRDVICTTLDGTGAEDYYTGSYTFDLLADKNESDLLRSLRELMTSTHKKESDYDDCRDLAVKTDCENGNGKVLLIYSSYSATRSQFHSSNGWNREHVWPKSLGGFDQNDNVGADLHHIRPSDARINSTRNNNKYGNTNGGKAVYGCSATNNVLGGYYANGYFEPLDNVKGDVARICLYIYVRYGGEWSKCSKITNVFQSVDVLLEWMAEDPVDTWEMGRNEVVAAYQGNRNVFIDYPELAFIMFGREIPANMTTPSGNAGSGSYNPPACQHTKTEIRGAKQASCTQEGYTGDTYCKDCGAKLSTGTKINATGHADSNRDNICDICGTSLESCSHSSTEVRGAKEATCSQEGYTGDTFCKKCNLQVKTGEAIPATPHTEVVEGAREATCVDEGATGTTTCSVCKTMLKANEPIPATGEHIFGEWAVTQEPTETETGTKEHTCSVCSLTETEEIPVKAPEEDPTAPPTEPSETPTEPDEAPTEPNNDKDEDPDDPFPIVWIIVAIAAALGGCAIVVVLIVKKKKD